MKKHLWLGILALSLLPGAALAADDPSIQGATREGIHKAMRAHVDETRLGKHYVIYDAAEGRLLRLHFAKLHQGIVRKGDFYVSCADFKDGKGRLFDLDFLVAEKGGAFRVLQALVHAVDGEKRPYQLEEVQEAE